jgi:hypothetical protein
MDTLRFVADARASGSIVLRANAARLIAPIVDATG